MEKLNQAPNKAHVFDEPARGAENFLRWCRSEMLRGGRITKTRGEVASFSPELGLVSDPTRLGTAAGGGAATLPLRLARRLLRWSVAPIALLAGASPAFAQDACVEVTPGEFVCEDNGAPATVQQRIDAPGEDVVVTLQDGFEVDVVTLAIGGTEFDGLDIEYANSVVIDQAGGTSTISGARGIDVYRIEGNISITTGGDVTGRLRDGIYAGNYSEGGIFIDSRAGTVTGGDLNNGITAENNGESDLFILTADVSTTGNDGINAVNEGGNLTIDSSAGTVSGQDYGINARNNGTGATTITTAAVTGSGGNAINVAAASSSTDLVIDTTAGPVTGSEDGINAVHSGTGTARITTADVTGQSGSGIAFGAAYGAGDIEIDSSAGTVTGANFGIIAGNSSTSNLSITTGDVVGVDFDGILATDDGESGAYGGADMTINTTAGSVSGGGNGIVARNSHTGDLVITTGDVTGGGEGILAENRDADGGNLTIDSTAGTVSGGTHGIIASNAGNGAISITTGDVNAAAENGIEVTGSGSVLAINTTGGTVTAAENGIRAEVDISGAVTVVTGDVNTTQGYGVRVRQAGDGDVVVDTTAGAITSGSSAVSVRNDGAGSVSITTGDATSTVSYAGVFTLNNGTDATIDTVGGDVNGVRYGVLVNQAGSGAVSITTGDVTSQTLDGISALGFFGGYATGTDIVIDSSAGTVTGADRGIHVRHGGTGQVSITTAAVTGSGGNGIDARTGSDATDVIIDTTAGPVTGAVDGITVAQDGSGIVRVTTADVIGQSRNGINITTYEDAGDIEVDSSAGTVTGDDFGILVASQSFGSVSITTGDVVGVSNDGISASDDGEAGIYGADMTINTTAGSVSGGGGNGITARNLGTGDLAITTGNVAGYREGILAQNSHAEGGNLSIDTTAGAVNGGGNGIVAGNFGSGTTRIVTGDITAGSYYGEGGNGIFANSGTTAGDLIIDTSSGTVTADNNGINASQAGSGSLSITTADVTGISQDGIRARITGDGTDLTIDSSAGSVTGGSDGIDARNDGTGALSITTANVSGNGYDGIFATNDGTDLTIDSSAGAVFGDRDGIDARNYGTGTLSVTTGDVTGDRFDAVNVRNEGTDLLIDTSAGIVTGAADGIEARQDGTGAVSVTTGDVTGTTRDGIRVINDDGTDLTIDSSAGSVTGGSDGIEARNFGTGALSVTTYNVTGSGYDGTFATNSGTDLTVDSSAGAVIGHDDGIDARNYGTGSLSVTAADVTGENFNGISATNSSSGTDLSIDSSAGAVTALYGNGIRAVNRGAGNMSIVTGDVTAASDYGEGGYGVFASNSETAGDLIVDTSSGAVTSDLSGIYAENSGTGSTTITTADVTSIYGNGIDAETSGNGLTIDSSAGSVFGGEAGIYARNNGTGPTAIITADVVGDSGHGIDARTGGDGLTIDSSAGSVSGLGTGIFATSIGTGATTITTGDVTGETERGIFVQNNPGASDLSIDSSAGSVNGSFAGITAFNLGSGALNIVTADVAATDISGGTLTDGIFAQNFGTDLALDTRAGTVTGDIGIRADNFGTSAMSIVTGDVNGLRFDAIAAIQLNGTDLFIDSTAGTVTGVVRGVDARNLGSGTLAITTGDVSSTNDDGVYAIGEGTDLVVDTSAGAITAGNNGVYAFNQGNGSTSVITGDITTANGSGVYARANESTTGLTIDTSGGTIAADLQGIFAFSRGSGTMSITTADVTSNRDNGILVINYSDNVVLDSTAGQVTGSDDGIDFISLGSGTSSIITADVTGIESAGINASAFGTSFSIDTSAGSVSGGTEGINARQFGSGALRIETGDVTGLGGNAIEATVGTGGTDLVINTTAGAVSGGLAGIDARNTGTGQLSITTGDVTGGTSEGINAVNGPDGSELLIDSSAGAVSGVPTGILADQQSAADLALFVNEVTGATGIETRATTGNTEITLAPTAVVTGTVGAAIDAGSTGGAITVRGSSGTISGATDGIYARSAGGDIVIDNLDLVEGLAGDGLDLASDGGDILVSAIDLVSGAAGNGIQADAGGGNIGIISSGGITGTVAGIAARTSGAGEIAFDLSGTTHGDAFGIDVATDGGGVTLLNGGTLTGGTFAVFASNAATGPIALRNDGTLVGAISLAGADDSLDNAGVFAAAGASNFGDGLDTLVNSQTIDIATNAEFLGLEQFSNAGLINLANGVTGGSLVTSGDYVGNGGTLAVDVDFANAVADFFTIGGAASGSTLIAINPLNLDIGFDRQLLLVDAGAGSEAEAFTIDRVPGFLALDVVFDAANNDFLIGLALDPKVFEANKLGEGAQALWYRSADAWSDHRASVRFAEDESYPFWAVVYGAKSERDENFSDPTGLALGNAVLDYSQDFLGLQAGVEHRAGENVTLGVTGGYLSSGLRLADGGARADFDVLNIGASIAFADGGFFAETLVKYDEIDGSLGDTVSGGLGAFGGELDGSAFGGLIELGYRFGDEASFVEPRVSVEYQETSLDDIGDLGASDLAGLGFSFEGFDGLRGSVGLRLGGEVSLDAGSTIGYFVDASAVREFEGDGITRFAFANGGAEFANDPLDTFARIQAGLSMGGEGPVSGFVQVETDVSAELTSFGGKAGIRVRF
ncbi:hypothetical protein [Alteraurantiacibacter aquimixticola]|uniref:Autotransporter domain-containing protein n=1 Tax=Alteraurantiacibacter aquimixticola TaxID=2489173 RepID=A0A4T3F0U2_9SPHN|nr:hypothetical protein [Alteraurantiacibacter aquimixticola]TIX49812.1 hypothetical protein E5222_13475 [Alteraurantiacibacter aquimixticola]